MLVVIALGGNALLQRGEPLEAKLQRKNVCIMAEAVAKLAEKNDLIICHGNGPQVGLLALQSECYKKVSPYPLDVLDAESQGMIGYIIQQEIDNHVPSKKVATLLTQVVVDQNDPAFANPTKPIGPVYSKEQAKKIAAEQGWQIAPDGIYFRRVVPSPQPQEIVEMDAAKALVKLGKIVVFGGGGGIPVVRNKAGHLLGVEAVIDKDNTAAFIANEMSADFLLILTDVEAVYADWGTDNQKSIKKISPDQLSKMDFAKGSMGPKITAASRFVTNTKHEAAIGRLSNVDEILKGNAGTRITLDAEAIEYY